MRVCVCIFYFSETIIEYCGREFVYLSWMEVLWTASVARVAAGDYLAAFANVTWSEIRIREGIGTHADI